MKKMKNKLSLDTFKIAKLSGNLYTIWGGRATTSDNTGGNTTGPKTNSSLCCRSTSCPTIPG